MILYIIKLIGLTSAILLTNSILRHQINIINDSLRNLTYRGTSYDDNGGITFTKEMIDNIPIPFMSEQDEMNIINLVDKIISGEEKENSIDKLNTYINNLYKLQSEDIELFS